MPNVSEEINREAQQDISKALVFSGRGVVTGIRLARSLSASLKRNHMNKPGRKSMRQLVGDGSNLTSIEITEKNIKSFEPFAKKYGVKFALQKDTGSDPPRQFVFFHSKSADAMTAAFRDYSQHILRKREKPSVLKKMDSLKKELDVKTQDRDPIRSKTQGEMEI